MLQCLDGTKWPDISRKYTISIRQERGMRRPKKMTIRKPERVQEVVQRETRHRKISLTVHATPSGIEQIADKVRSVLSPGAEVNYALA
ncbi:MAG: hypothetical protein WC858_04610 [Parcubacteria group bacterium]|jgi:hypothetical protein